MRYLLDTHTFIWFDSFPEKLSKTVLHIILDKNNELYLSLVSLWEIQIKTQLGKMELDGDLKCIVDLQVKTNGLHFLNIELAHIYGLHQLPFHHRDPFDRLLLSQSKVEKLTFLTVDDQNHRYNSQVACIW